MRKKRPVFWLVLVVFAAGALFWLVHVPYRPSALYRLIPPDTVFVSHHRLLAERWDDFAANPLARTLITSMGLDVEEVGLWSEDPETRIWLDKLLARDLLIAHAPAMGPRRDPAWILGGWIGGESIRLRWLLSRGRLSGFEKVRRHAGGAYWLVDLGEDEAPFLSISVVEGMLVGVLSEDPHAVRHILDVYDGLAPAHPLSRTGAWDSHGCADDTTPDRGWFIGPNERGMQTTYFFGFDQVDEKGLRGALCRAEPGELPALQTRDIEIPSRFFGGVPFVLIGLNPEAGYALWLNLLPPALQEVLQGLYETDMAGLLLLAATGGEYAGTMAGISVPAVMGAWPVIDEAEALSRLQALMDRLNALFRWGVVLTDTRVDDRPVYVVESTANTPYAAFRSRERVAFTFVDGWMVVATHALPLMKLLERYDRPEAIFEADQGGWQREVRQGAAAAYGYLDLRGGARTLRLAISAWSVKLLFDDPQGSREQRQRLKEIRAWIDTLEPMGGAHLWLDQREGWLTLRFALGEQER
jgi:hypothetical protein